MKRTPLRRSRAPMTLRARLRRATPLHASPSRRARPDEPLATWCAAQIPGVCTGRATDRHHLLPRSAGGGDEAANTVDLCAADHAHIHAHPAWAYEAGWLKRRAA